MAVMEQMKLLINLARIDGSVADREKLYISNIGKANGISSEIVEPLFDRRHELVIPKDLSDDQKFEYIFSLVQLMKIDERLYKEEIMFCSKVAANLGYDQEVMFEMMLHVRAAAMENNEMLSLKELTQKYLSH